MTSSSMASPSSLFSATDFGGWSSDPKRPDYASPAYREMAPRWQIVHDVRGGTEAIRAKADRYLPRFEAETDKDWQARVNQTFAKDHYAMTLAEHVGLVTAEPIKLGKDVPEQIRELTEDFDGEGNHIDVFAATALDAAFHLGHCGLYTDYPKTNAIGTLADERDAMVRPYVTLYPASDILSWQTVTVGGVEVIVQVVLRETVQESAGEGSFGTVECVRYREIRQAVEYDTFTGAAKSLGAITFQVYKKTERGDGSTGSTESETFTKVGEPATIVGPKRIPLRVVYGGEKVGTLQTKPHLYGLAVTSVEETQVQSDYARVMHLCNVPTPIFIGRDTNSGQTIQMGQGLDIPIGGSAIFLEPTGAAISSTRDRLDDLRAHMRRQGATSADEGGKAMTATEAAMVAKQRNAKLKRAARSLQDALEGVLADFAAFLKIETGSSVKSGGSVSVTQDFAGQVIDPALLTVYTSAFGLGALPLEALLYALEKGRLPDDFSSEDAALRLIAEDAAAAERLRLDAEKAKAAANPANPADPAAGNPNPNNLPVAA